MEPNSAIAPEFRARVIEAAEQLYAESGRQRMPSASEVRAIARTDMNLTTIVVREWKRQQTARPVPVAVSVPEPVQQAMSEALASVWATAQELANASLRSAEQQWQIEREEIAADLKEVSGEVERLEGECKVATERCNAATLNYSEALERIELQTGELNALREQLARQEALTQQAETRAQEIEHRANDLKGELSIAHEEAAAVRNELSEARRIHAVQLSEYKDAAATQLEQLNQALASAKGKQEASAELLEKRTTELMNLRSEFAALQGEVKNTAEQLQYARDQQKKAEDERKAADLHAAAAGERAANLEGRAATLEEQNAALLARLGKPAN